MRFQDLSESRNIVKAIRACDGGKNLIYKEIAGASHGAMEREFRKDDMYDWLLSKSKAVDVIEESESTDDITIPISPEEK